MVASTPCPGPGPVPTQELLSTNFLEAHKLVVELLLPSYSSDVVYCDSETYTKPIPIFGNKSIVSTIGDYVLSNPNEDVSYQMVSSVLEKFPLLFHCTYKTNEEDKGIPLWKKLYNKRKFKLLNSLLVHNNKNWTPVPAIPFDRENICDASGRSVLMSEIMSTSTFQTICKNNTHYLFDMLNMERGKQGGSFLHFFASRKNSFTNFENEEMDSHVLSNIAKFICNEKEKLDSFIPANGKIPCPDKTNDEGYIPLEIAIMEDNYPALLYLVCRYGASWANTYGDHNESLKAFAIRNDAKDCLEIIEFISDHYSFNKNVTKEEFVKEKTVECVGCLYDIEDEKRCYKLPCGHFMHTFCLSNKCSKANFRCVKCFQTFDDTIFRKCPPTIQWKMGINQTTNHKEMDLFNRAFDTYLDFICSYNVKLDKKSKPKHKPENKKVEEELAKRTAEIEEAIKKKEEELAKKTAEIEEAMKKKEEELTKRTAEIEEAMKKKEEEELSKYNKIIEKGKRRLNEECVKLRDISTAAINMYKEKVRINGVLLKDSDQELAEAKERLRKILLLEEETKLDRFLFRPKRVEERIFLTKDDETLAFKLALEKKTEDIIAKKNNQKGSERRDGEYTITSHIEKLPQSTALASVCVLNE
nr:MAG: latency-associated protein E3 ligase WSSV403 [White spot syndrome virus]BDX27759.1 MAG: latency-associated protein E3 ligase WSSV403 [White spot syndrome virus]BDX27919.1 MAG: latency-associated protein E3 ligase WSSV403 [White spot syndrome virus]BDX28081.1 MAG: latency-associated protein E3 ligase WSSV403 [White spot syndrome virus]